MLDSRLMRALLAHCSVPLALLAACGGQTDAREMDRADLVLGSGAAAQDDGEQAASAVPSQGLDAEQASAGSPLAEPSKPSSSVAAQSEQQGASGAGSATLAAPSGDMIVLSDAEGVSADTTENSADTTEDTEEEKTIVTNSFDAGDLPDDGQCRVWLDGTTSPLFPEDLTVAFEGQPWSATESCSDEPQWYLEKDDVGLWLMLCPSACELLVADPTGVLLVEATYWTEVNGGVAR